jgi:hypothetical protein
MKNGVHRDLAVEGKSRFDDKLDGMTIGHREGTGKTETHRTGSGVGFTAERDSAPAEHFGFG